MENYDKYIDYLYSAQNVGASPTQRNLYSKEKYEKLLASVLEVLRENKDATLDELREKLFEKANIKATLEDFFIERKKFLGR